MKHVISLLLLLVTELAAQWSTDPTQNLKVAGGGINPEICIDGNGGCFIVWETGTSGNRRLLRMQHLNRYGYKSFPESGVSLASEEFDQSTPFFLTHGGEGTAIVLFYDTRFIAGKFVGRVLAQRVDTTGTLLWGNSAVRPTQSDSSQSPVALLADGKGGAFLFWAEDRDGDGIQEMFGNRTSANGQLLWGQNGKIITVYENNEIRTHAASDLQDGFFVAFEKKIDLYVQHLNGHGELLWQEPVKMPIGIWGVLTSDNSGGFFWTAHEQMGYLPPWGAIYRTRMFRYDFAGQSFWPEAGIAITDSAIGSQAPEVIVNGQNDVSVIYLRLYESNPNIFAQRLNFSGDLKLEYGGRPVSAYPSRRAFNQSCLGRSNDVIVSWADGRMVAGDIYAQSIAQDGSLQWHADIAVTTRVDFQRSHRISSDGNGGCIVTWYEIGTDSGWGIFAQQICRNGKLGEVQTTSVSSEFYDPSASNVPFSFSLYPNPFKDTVRFIISHKEKLPITIQIFDLAGRKVWQTQSHGQLDGRMTLQWDGRNQEGGFLPSGIYLTKVAFGKHSVNQKLVLIR